MKHARRRVESEESFGLRDTLIWCGIPIVIVLLVRMFLFGFYVICLLYTSPSPRDRG